jgi:hypothetical protein
MVAEQTQKHLKGQALWLQHALVEIPFMQSRTRQGTVDITTNSYYTSSRFWYNVTKI